jgi:hypothetical protein
MAIDGPERTNYSIMYLSISVKSRRFKEEDRAKFTDYFAQLFWRLCSATISPAVIAHVRLHGKSVSVAVNAYINAVTY